MPVWLMAAAVLAMGSGCKKRESSTAKPAPTTGPSSPAAGSRFVRVVVDGSSTVFPILDAAAELFQELEPRVDVQVGISGTGGGMRRLCTRESDIANASRPITTPEAKLCRQNGVEYVEVPIAFDGIAVLVHPKNTWAETITTAELRRIWEPAAQGRVDSWKDVRESWPDRPLRLYGAGGDSGTYDYFTHAIVGQEHQSRDDYVFSEDDNLIVEGVANDEAALGFFGFAYYSENTDRLKVLPVDDGQEGNGSGAIAPNTETIADGTYQPLSRPLLLYVAIRSLDRPAVRGLIDFLLTRAGDVIRKVGYVALPETAYAQAKQRVANRLTGSALGGQGSKVGVPVKAFFAPDKPPRSVRPPSAPPKPIP